MQPNGGNDINVTIDAWADIVLKIWKEKMESLEIHDTGALEQSLLYELIRNSGTDVEKIAFSFKLYGKFVDMGVGREIKKGNSGDLGFTPKRKAKEWHSGTLYRQILKLRKILKQKYGEGIAQNIIKSLRT